MVAHEKISKYQCQWGAHGNAIYLIIIISLGIENVSGQWQQEITLRLSLLNLMFGFPDKI